VSLAALDGMFVALGLFLLDASLFCKLCFFRNPSLPFWQEVTSCRIEIIDERVVQNSLISIDMVHSHVIDLTGFKRCVESSKALQTARHPLMRHKHLLNS
jgi:hypothetical protein